MKLMLTKMWNRIALWWYSFRRKFSPIHEDIANTVTGKSPSTQENHRDNKARQAVRKAFEQQEQSMNARALKPHDPCCSDPLTCAKKICFIKKPDTIVKKSTVSENERRKSYVRRTKMRRIAKDI